MGTVPLLCLPRSYQQFYLSLTINEPLFFNGVNQRNEMKTVFREENELYDLTFDILQIPRYKTVYTYPSLPK